MKHWHFPSSLVRPKAEVIDSETFNVTEWRCAVLPPVQQPRGLKKATYLRRVPLCRVLHRVLRVPSRLQFPVILVIHSRTSLNEGDDVMCPNDGLL